MYFLIYQDIRAINYFACTSDVNEIKQLPCSEGCTLVWVERFFPGRIALNGIPLSRQYFAVRYPLFSGYLGVKYD
jgi:hypothetical protein